MTKFRLSQQSIWKSEIQTAVWRWVKHADRRFLVPRTNFHPTVLPFLAIVSCGSTKWRDGWRRSSIRSLFWATSLCLSQNCFDDSNIGYALESSCTAAAAWCNITLFCSGNVTICYTRRPFYRIVSSDDIGQTTTPSYLFFRSFEIIDMCHRLHCALTLWFCGTEVHFFSYLYENVIQVLVISQARGLLLRIRYHDYLWINRGRHDFLPLSPFIVFVKTHLLNSEC